MCVVAVSVCVCVCACTYVAMPECTVCVCVYIRHPSQCGGGRQRVPSVWHCSTAHTAVDGWESSRCQQSRLIGKRNDVPCVPPPTKHHPTPPNSHPPIAVEHS